MKRTSLLLAVAVSACGLDMEKHYLNIRDELTAGQFDAAATYIEGTRADFYGEKARLLYFMDKGMVLHLAKRYQESNALLEQAKQTAEDLWTDSIGENAAAWLATDNSISYQGEDFEKVMLHLVAAMNYLSTGDSSAARVEARQVTAKLELYNSKYEQKSAYADDAFARWLSGKLGETAVDDTQALNDAWIDYKRAIAVYENDYTKRYRTALPKQLVADALRVTEALGPDFAPEHQGLRQKYPSVRWTPQTALATQGRAVLLHWAGEAPYKIDQYWTAMIAGDPLRIAFPKFVAKQNRILGARLRVGGLQAQTELAQNVTAIALRNLDDHMGRIKAKAIARAVTKFTAGKVAQEGGKALQKKGGEAGAAGAALQVAGALWNIGSAVAEEADKRSWLTLPSLIGVAELVVPPGPVQANLDLLDSRGSVVRTATLTGQVKAGETLFLWYRSFE